MRPDRASRVLVDRAGGEGLSLWTQEARKGGFHLKDKPAFHGKVNTPNPGRLTLLFYSFKMTTCSFPQIPEFQSKKFKFPFFIAPTPNPLPSSEEIIHSLT